MRYFSYVEPTSDDDLHITKNVYSEREILEEFWHIWTTEMKGNGFGHMINQEACIDDWCTLHWAHPEDVFVFKEGYQGKVFVVNEFNMMDPTFSLATLICLNDQSVKIDRFVNIEKELIRHV